ncbi:MAG: hypothetical protein L0J31_09730, partial [Corynebacterium sp.]|nr:hypothetical protein [Corynebacterium sp.]
SVTEQHIAERVGRLYGGGSDGTDGTEARASHRVLVVSDAPAWHVAADREWGPAEVAEVAALAGAADADTEVSR